MSSLRRTPQHTLCTNQWDAVAGPHSKGKELALGLNLTSRSDANQETRLPQGLTRNE